MRRSPRGGRRPPTAGFHDWLELPSLPTQGKLTAVRAVPTTRGPTRARRSAARGERVDGDSEREDERGVFAGRHVDAVGLAHAEPLLGDRRDRVAVPLDLVL